MSLQPASDARREHILAIMRQSRRKFAVDRQAALECRPVAPVRPRRRQPVRRVTPELELSAYCVELACRECRTCGCYCHKRELVAPVVTTQE